MQIKVVTVNRKFNLTNYEMLSLGAEAELSPDDNALEVWNILRDNIEMCFIDMQRKKEGQQGAVLPSPQVSASSGAPQAPPTNTAAAIETALKPNSNDQVVSIKTEGNKIIIKTLTFLGTERYGQIKEALKPFHAKWVSAGKDSRWEVPL